MICFIPTKGRFKTQTYKLFEEVGIKVYHFIEPQEINLYNVPNPINIEKNNQGLVYVRNFMLQYAKKNNYEWIIICDDDVISFGIFNGKTVKTNAGIWWKIFDKAKKLPFELIGINYSQHAWHEKNNYSINRNFADVCVLIHVSKICWEFDKNLLVKVDRDFTLQTIQNGNGILRFNHYWFSCPDIGTNTGGLYDVYKNKKDEESSIKMCYKWHPFITIKRKKYRVDMKIDFKKFAMHHKKTFK